MSGHRLDHRDGDDRGFALIIVLWALVLVSGLALAAASGVRSDSFVTRNMIDEARARHLAEAAIYQTVATLLHEETKDTIDFVDGRTRTVTVLGTPVAVRIVDECAKVDLNTGWSGLIVGLVGGQQPGAEGFALAQAILDWRDPDRRRRRKGAEDDDYAAAGYSYGAGDSLFETIAELQLVKGMTPALYRRLAPYITVDCLNAGVDAAVASKTVLASIPGIEPAALATFIEARRGASQEQAEKLAESLQKDDRYFDLSPQAAFEITASVAQEAGTKVTWRAVVWLTGDDSRPYVIRAWERVVPGGESS